MGHSVGKLVGGVGVYEKGKYFCALGGVMTKEYSIWQRVIQRAYSCDFHQRSPTYIGCSMSENFKNFQYFAEWCNGQIGFRNKGWHLDKDILGVGEKQYHEDTCVFIPAELNNLLIQSNSSRGEYPVGVSFHKPSGKYTSKVRMNGANKHIGLYDTAKEAFEAYKVAKESYVRAVIERYKGDVDARVYIAVLNWKVNIND